MEDKTFFNGRWKVVEEIGKGTTGTVYKVLNSRGGVNSYAAIKEILLPKEQKEILNMYSQGATDSDITEYFENKANEWIAKEVNFLEQFKGNPNIVSIEDHDVLEREDMLGRIVIIRMELLETLEDYILTHEVTDKEIIKMGLSILNALVDCEERNVLHRDIKPQNVFVNKNKIFKLGDFSESKEIEKTVSNMTQRGTPNYMAPELYKGERGSKSIDTYSLGIMLYQYFNNNRLPFVPDKYKFEDAQKVLERRMNGDELPAPKNASPELSRIILKACSYKPEDRYQSAMDFKEDLQRVYDDIKTSTVLFGKSKVVSEEKQVVNSHDKTVGIYSDEKETPKKRNKSKGQFGEDFIKEKKKEEKREETGEDIKKEEKKDYNETVGIFYESSKPTTNKPTAKKKQFGTEEPKEEKLESVVKERKTKEVVQEFSPRIEEKEKTINKNEPVKEENKSSNKWIEKSIFPALGLMIIILLISGSDMHTTFDYIALIVACVVPCFFANYQGEKENWSTWKRIGIGFCVFMAILFLFIMIDGTTNNTSTSNSSDKDSSYHANGFKEITAQQIASFTKDRGIILYIGRDGCHYTKVFTPVVKKVVLEKYEYDNIYYLDLGKIYDFDKHVVLDVDAFRIMQNLEGRVGSSFPEYEYNSGDFSSTPMLMVISDNSVDGVLKGYVEEDELSSFIGTFSFDIKYGN